MSKVTKWMQVMPCPECGEVGTIRKILWGMPTQEAFESGDFVIGGCLVQGDGSDPKYGCQICSWNGNYIKGQLVSLDPYPLEIFPHSNQKSGNRTWK
jgi:hypothetical protein